jgi:hypothetical protein
VKAVKLKNRFRTFFLTVIIASLLLSSQVLASEVASPVKDIILNIYYHANDMDLVDVKFDIYLVATVDETGNIAIAESFDSYDGNILDIQDNTSDEELEAIVSGLESYVISENITPTDSGTTNEEGRLKFPTDSSIVLQKGLYLVLGGNTTQNNYIYEATPFITLLPRSDKVNTAIPKFVSRPYSPPGNPPENPSDPENPEEPNEPGGDTSGEDIPSLLAGDYAVSPVYLSGSVNGDEDTSPETPGGMTLSGSFLPQTGQLWWPIPLLTSVGLAFIIIGLARRRTITDEE